MVIRRKALVRVVRLKIRLRAALSRARYRLSGEEEWINLNTSLEQLQQNMSDIHVLEINNFEPENQRVIY